MIDKQLSENEERAKVERFVDSFDNHGHTLNFNPDVKFHIVDCLIIVDMYYIFGFDRTETKTVQF
jgi:hypothetical protein